MANSIFELYDPEKLGIIRESVAAGFLSSSKLSNVVLGKVWGIADEEGNGFLTRKGVCIALRLIGHAQRGEPVSEGLLSRREYMRIFLPLWPFQKRTHRCLAGFPPNIEGFFLPVPQRRTAADGVRPPSQKVTALLPLMPRDRVRFVKIFHGCSPVDGMLGGMLDRLRREIPLTFKLSIT